MGFMHFLLGVRTAFAQSATSDLPGTTLTLEQIVPKIFEWTFIIIALAAFLGLLWAGIMYITAGGDTAKAEKARKSILWTLLGVILAVLAYTIVRLVVDVVSNQDLGPAGTNTTATAGIRTPTQVKAKIGTKDATGKYYNPCVSETPQGCIDSDGYLTTLRSDGTLVGGDEVAQNGSVAGAKYGISILDSFNTLSGSTMVITEPTAQFNNPYGIRLDNQPAANIVVAITTTGTLSLRLSDTSLTFSPTDYNEPQGLNVRYLGGNKSGDSATVTLTGSDGSVRTITFTIE